MENASKALIMAGSVLIALMIIGALLLMFNNLSSYQETNTQNTREAQIVEFNQQYETYNRDDVRGSDLYSLINRVIDYNERKSTVGKEGAEVSYKPMELVINLNNTKEFTPDNTNAKLLTNNVYRINNTNNEFRENVKAFVEKMKTAYGESSLTNLTTGLTKIFIDDNSDATAKQKAVAGYISACGQTISSYDDIKNGSTIREDIYKYYEYVQFKRAHFKCDSDKIKYDKDTGRIIGMQFTFTGKFN